MADDCLAHALRDDDGRLAVVRVESATGQLVLVPRSATGGVLTFWEMKEPETPRSAKR